MACVPPVADSRGDFGGFMENVAVLQKKKKIHEFLF
jgi:hypothetical protein